jgi:hypothetical protein
MVIDTIARIIIVLLGASLCLLALLGVYAPRKLMEWLKRMMDQDWGIYFTVVIRLMLGLALIVAAAGSRFPLAIVGLGWVAIVAAIAGALLGRQRLRKFISWWIERFSSAGIRVWVLFALAFGGFLIYAVMPDSVTTL